MEGVKESDGEGDWETKSSSGFNQYNKKINKKCSRNILHLAIVLDQLLKLFEDS